LFVFVDATLTEPAPPPKLFLRSEKPRFSKIEANRLNIERNLVCPLDLVKDVIRSISPLANEKKNYLRLNVNGKIPDKCMLDSLRMRQILMNLIGNSNKFTEEGDVRISIDYEPENSILFFIIEDTGIGISQDEQLKIFQPFTQADGTTTRKFGGTGLGLIICKRLIEIMDGRIKLTSEVGKGTQVAFSIPVDVPEECQVDNKLDVDDDVVDFNQASYSNVLVVEDVPLNQKLARIFLEKLDCNVDIANNGEEALAMVQEKVYEVVLMDYHMPGMNGIEATKMIHDWEKEHRDGDELVRIIAMTANVSNEFRDKCEQAGMDGFLAKPFTLDGLRNVINNLGGGKNST